MSGEPARRSRPRRRPSAKLVAQAATEHLVRTESWNGLRSGDPVLVSGVRISGATWEFRAHILNTHNGTEVIEVVGGKPGDRTVRSFDPGRIYAVVGRSRSTGRGDKALAERPSLAEAPQLPLF